jgi:hypothetical protein
MSKYAQFATKEVVAPYKIHPIWRGIGFVMMIIVPIVAWAAADELLKYAQGLEVSEVQRFISYLSGPFVYPEWVYSVPYLDDFARWTRGIELLKAKLLLFVIFLVAFSGLLSIIYAMIYRMAVPRYAPLDEPAPKIRAKKYTR